MMRKVLVLPVLLGFCAVAVAQESEVTTVTTRTTTVADDFNLLSPWNIEDAVPIGPQQVDLRFRFEWANWDLDNDGGFFGFDDDDFDDDGRRIGRREQDSYRVAPTIVWGPYEDVEFSFDLPVDVGNGGELWTNNDGNADLYIGTLWRFLQEGDDWTPAMALAGKARIPTGDASNGVDAELRLILTKNCASWIRSHFNAWILSVNGNNDENARHFQYGGAIGADGPLCAEGAVRWVADYVWQIGPHYGVPYVNTLEVGTQWAIDDTSTLATGVQIGLDDEEDTLDYGARVNYSYSIRY